MNKIAISLLFFVLFSSCARPAGSPPGSAPLDALVQVEYLDITRKGFSPKVFRVAKGTLIRFIVTTDDKPRAIRIEGIPREWQVVPDQKTSFEWYAIRLGKAKIKCTDNCGMKGLWGGATILVTQ